MIPKRHILSPVQALFLTKALNENYCQIISGLPLKALLQNKTPFSMKMFSHQILIWYPKGRQKV